MGYDTDRDEVFIPSAVACRWFNWAQNVNDKVAAVSRVLRQLCEEERTKWLRVNKCNAWGKGFVWEGPHRDAMSTVKTDIQHRIAEWMKAHPRDS